MLYYLLLICGQLSFVPIQVYTVPTEQTVYGDVLSHIPYPVTNSDRQFNIWQSARYANRDPKISNRTHQGIYCLRGRGLSFPKPKVSMVQIKEFIPPIITNPYLRFHDEPMDVISEWSAMTIVGMSLVEDTKNKVHKEWCGDLLHTLEYSIYAVATYMAIEKYDPQYLQDNPDFKCFIGWWLKGAENTFNTGKELPLLKWDAQNKLLYELRTSKDASNIRNCIRTNFDSVFLK